MLLSLRTPIISMNYIYPHDIWTRICILGFFDHDSITMTFYYIYFKGFSNIRLGFRYLWGYVHWFEIKNVQLLPFPSSNFQIADLNVSWLIRCQMYFMTSSLIRVSQLFPDQLLTCRPAISLQSRLKSATKDCKSSRFLRSLYLTLYHITLKRSWCRRFWRHFSKKRNAADHCFLLIQQCFDPKFVSKGFKRQFYPLLCKYDF